MSLDVWLEDENGVEVWSYNITHNLNKMADVVGLYEPLWRPEELGIVYAYTLTPVLAAGLMKLQYEKQACEAKSPSNGWGTYEGLYKFVSEYMVACAKHPFSKIFVSR